VNGSLKYRILESTVSE